MASRAAAPAWARLGARRFAGSRVAPALVVVVLVAVAVGVRTPRALHEALWADEVGSARIIVAPGTHAALARIRKESSPPGWFFLGRVTHEVGTRLTSAASFFRPLTSMAAVRLWSVLFSALAVALVVVYARRFLPLWAAGVAGLAVALGVQLVFHGSELRAYAMLLVLATAFPLALEWALERPSLRRLAAFAAFVAVGAMTHYFFLAVLFTGLLWLWLFGPSVRTRLTLTAAAGAGLLPLVAWAPVVAFQASRVNGYFPPFGYRRMVDVYSAYFGGPEVWSPYGFAARAGFALAVLLGCILLARRAEGRLAALLAVVPVAVTALVWAAGLRVFDTRNLIVAAPFAAIAVAAIAASLPIRPLALAAGVVLAAAVVWAYSQDRHLGRTPYNQIDAGLVRLGWTPADPIAMFARYPQSRPLAWHLPGHPGLRAADPGTGVCRALYAVVTTAAGRDWLARFGSRATARREYAWYGTQPVARRELPDVVIVRLAPTRAALAAALADHGFLFHSSAHARPACLAPRA